MKGLSPQQPFDGAVAIATAGLMAESLDGIEAGVA